MSIKLGYLSIVLLPLLCNATEATPPNASQQYSAPQPVLLLYQATHKIEWEQNKNVISGCYEAQPDICSSTIGDIDISENNGNIRYKDKAVKIDSQSIIGKAPKIPKLRYFLPGIYGTVSPTTPDAICVEYAYDTFNGGAGPWNALIMILMAGKRPVAYRFDGINNDCRSWRTDGKGNFLYPSMEITHIPTQAMKERNEPARKALVWYACTTKGCKRHFDPRPVYQGESEKIWHTEPGNPPFIGDRPRD